MRGSVCPTGGGPGWRRQGRVGAHWQSVSSTTVSLRRPQGHWSRLPTSRGAHTRTHDARYLAPTHTHDAEAPKAPHPVPTYVHTTRARRHTHTHGTNLRTHARTHACTHTQAHREARNRPHGAPAHADTHVRMHMHGPMDRGWEPKTELRPRKPKTELRPTERLGIVD